MLRRNGSGMMNMSSNTKINSNITNTNACGSTSASPMDALPKQFVASMKTLFDILDDQHTGFVRFLDIEKGWQDDGCKGLPHGVIDSLRKVTPPSGLLSFDRFCAGLKLCLLRNQSASIGNASPGASSVSPVKPPRPPSAPLLDIESTVHGNTTWAVTNVTTATVRPHKIVSSHRALSLPQLSPDSEIEAEMVSTDVDVYNSPPPPPKPPRASAASQLGAPNTPPTPLDKAEIRHALQNWQMGILLNEMGAKEKHDSAYIYNQFPYRGCADGGSSSATDSVTGTVGTLHPKKTSSKRREPRRHTLQNGIDYNMLKRLKQFEEEREVLLTGLDAVEKARDWYLQQIANVQEKIKYLGRIGHVEQWSEVQQERLEFQRARVYEVNRNLATLADCWERGGFPLHFNLAIRSPGKALNQRNVSGNSGGLLQPVDRLRQQNHNLTNEVNLKTDRIALLEREKQSLMRELYELRQRVGIVGRSSGFVTVLGQSSPSSSGGLGEADVVF
ncbi:PREDICTED: suppressor APC domain-containing protein 2 [Rhagoletis zephyria]|uniref:suppressor APC domain-containing protein 2 n=1 Tax=Rhagoletis zephyria TaxID=28612 RepID=UPI00081166D7|nr:PREDICTED: suppressor APC domain-containing protein 2 [Rhagoletis zephyria]